MKLLVNKNTNKDSLSLQLTSISGKLPNLKGKKLIIFPWQELEERESYQCKN